MTYGFNFEGKTFYPSGALASHETHESLEQRNRATSAAEVGAFKVRSAERWFVYVKEHDGPRFDGELTTWMGDHLASFTWAGPAFRCVFGDTRRNLRARGIDGREWYGTAYVSSGDYARIRVVGS